ncbi:unnamed protein product [Heligmosomoides polygyrus]|uniref:Uncharacterized protein n=1 Tax=Heligmosomoides polygyrus TaxID=6339 RepID=A0A183FA04_HELPZ|nr:unnamed protein product [Heligmosomoides polygyrus]
MTDRFQPPRCAQKRPAIAFREKRSAAAESDATPPPPLQSVDRTAASGPLPRSRRNIVQTKPGFYMTLEVETRFDCVLLNSVHLLIVVGLSQASLCLIRKV